MAFRLGTTSGDTSSLVSYIAIRAQLPKSTVRAVFKGLNYQILEALTPPGPGQTSLLDIGRIHLVRRPARPARQVTNPFTRQKTTLPARPPTAKVKIKPHKHLNEMLLGSKRFLRSHPPNMI